MAICVGLLVLAWVGAAVSIGIGVLIGSKFLNLGKNIFRALVFGDVVGVILDMNMADFVDVVGVVIVGKFLGTINLSRCGASVGLLGFGCENGEIVLLMVEASMC